jgi:hypothetical protein
MRRAAVEVRDAGRICGETPRTICPAYPGSVRRRRPSCSTPTATSMEFSPTSTSRRPSCGEPDQQRGARPFECHRHPVGARRAAGGPRRAAPLGGWDLQPRRSGVRQVRAEDPLATSSKSCCRRARSVNRRRAARCRRFGHGPDQRCRRRVWPSCGAGPVSGADVASPASPARCGPNWSTSARCASSRGPLVAGCWPRWRWPGSGSTGGSSGGITWTVLKMESYRVRAARELEIHRQAGRPRVQRQLDQAAAHRALRRARADPGEEDQDRVLHRCAQTLESLRDQHPIVEALLRYREVEKLRSTYGESLAGRGGGRRPDPRHVPPDRGPDGAALVGPAQSAQHPGADRAGSAVPEGLRAPRPVHRLLVADYDQVELRVIAHLSGDPD